MDKQVNLVGTKDLERVLGRKDFFAIAVGQIIGAGIFTLLPQSIGLTGRSASFAFLFAAVITLLKFAPRLFVMGTARMRGGNYTYIALLSTEKLAGAFLVIHALSNISLSMYALTIGEYFCQMVDGLNFRVVAVIVFTIVTVVNLIGIKKAAIVQHLLVLCLLVALAVFTAFGIFKVDYNAYFQPEGFMTNGFFGFCQAAALLTFACGGAQNLINLSAEAKNPTKDIPFVIIVATSFVAVFYVFMAIVATGILPVEQVADQPLSVVANVIFNVKNSNFGKGLYIFFMIGGAMFALLTTLNAQLSACTKPLLQGCADGWFPESFAAVNKRFRTPHRIILLFYVIGLLPLVFNFSMKTISGTAVFSNSIIDILIAAFVFRLPKVLPEEWAASKWHCSQKTLVFWTVAGTVASVFAAYMSLRTMDWKGMLLNIAVCAAALLYGVLRSRSGKVHMEVSYEAN